MSTQSLCSHAGLAVGRRALKAVGASAEFARLLLVAGAREDLDQHEPRRCRRLVGLDRPGQTQISELAVARWFSLQAELSTRLTAARLIRS